MLLTDTVFVCAPIRAHRYQDLLAAGLNLAELHLDDQHSNSSDNDSINEFGSEDWEAAPMDAVDEQEEQARQASSSSSTSGQQQQIARSDAASETTDSDTGMATVVVSNTHQDDGRHAASEGAPQELDVATNPDSRRRKQQQHHAAASGVGSKGIGADMAAAGSVSAAALQLAARKDAPPSSLSMIRLAAEANRNLTGQEKKEKGGVSTFVLRTYITAAGGLLVALCVVAVMATEQTSRVMTDTFLGWWAADMFHKTLWFYIAIYASLGVLYSLLTFVRCVCRLADCLTDCCAVMHLNKPARRAAHCSCFEDTDLLMVHSPSVHASCWVTVADHQQAHARQPAYLFSRHQAVVLNFLHVTSCLLTGHPGTASPLLPACVYVCDSAMILRLQGAVSSAHHSDCLCGPPQQAAHPHSEAAQELL